MATLNQLYGDFAQVEKGRYDELVTMFEEKFGDTKGIEFFSAPGRTEIIGNHTDHNGGMILAGSIDLDTIGAAVPNGTSQIHIFSQGYKNEITVDLEALDKVEKKAGSNALLAGMMEATKKFGFQTGGFNACISTKVISAAGVSSSASFEMLICSIINYFFNDGAIDYPKYARIGQYAENVYWLKASGLMDQMACAVGGPILLDFADENKIQYEKVDFSFDKMGYRLVIVNTGKGHADLSEEYSSVPSEMKEVAALLGVSRLCETNIDALLEKLPEVKNDRAALRALHFFTENQRVQDGIKAVEEGDNDKLLKIIEASGDSSWKWLQNCYSLQDVTEQKICLTLALTRLFLDKIGKGVCRVHGGGFAGVIMAVVPVESADEYVQYIGKYVGENNVYPMNIRAVGAVHVEL